jgi:guanylate kinase
MRTQIATFTGPSGVGKSSACREVLRSKPDWKLIPSVTTREPRQKDLPGEYDCISAEEYQRRLHKGAFLWSIEAHGHLYGTPIDDLNRVLASPSLAIMLIEPKSVHRIRNIFDGFHQGCSQMLHFYFCAPSENETRKRLERRKSRGDKIDEAEIARRISECRAWDSQAYASGIPYIFLPGEITTPETASRVIDVLYHIGGVP